MDAQRKLPMFEPDCAILSAYSASFGVRGLSQPMIQEPSTSRHDPVEPSLGFEFDVLLPDEGIARQIGSDDQAFNLARMSFSGALKRDMCQLSAATRIVHEGGTVELRVKFRLDATAELNATVGFPREVRVQITDCEAN